MAASSMTKIRKPAKVARRRPPATENLGDLVRRNAQAAGGQIKQTIAEAACALWEEASRAVMEQKDRTVIRMAGVTGAIDRTAHALHAVKVDDIANYVEAVGERLHRAADYIEQASITELAEDVRQVVKRHPALVTGGLLLSGLLLTGLLRAGNSSIQRGASGGGARSSGGTRAAVREGNGRKQSARARTRKRTNQNA